MEMVRLDIRWRAGKGVWKHRRTGMKSVEGKCQEEDKGEGKGSEDEVRVRVRVRRGYSEKQAWRSRSGALSLPTSRFRLLFRLRRDVTSRGRWQRKDQRGGGEKVDRGKAE